MKRGFFIFAILIVFSICLFASDEADDFVENPALRSELSGSNTEGRGRIVGDKKYFGRDYIVKNPRATLPQPEFVPFVKTDSTQPFEFLRVVSKVEPQECEVWTEDQRVSFSELTPYSPRIAVKGDTIHVVWEEYEEVFYKRSVDGGTIWGDSILISNSDQISSITPDLAADHQNVYVVWEDWCSISQDCGIYFRKSSDGGENWLPIQPLALAGPDYYEYYRPTMAAKESSIFVAFGKNVDSDPMVKFKKSSDCGENWSQEIHVSDRSVSGHWAKLVLNSAGLYVVHQSGLSIWCNRTTDWGDSWSDDIFISDMEGSIAQWPSMAADDNSGVYITWVDAKNSPYPWTGDIFLRKSTDNGETWDSITALTDNHLCVESDACADRHSVHVVWHDERHNEGNGNVEIYHRRSTNLGATWAGDIRLTDAPYQSGDPRITEDKGKLYMVWVDNRHEPDPQAVYFKKGVWYYPGDANGDKIINSADVVYLVNFLFKAGPAPNAYQAGDVNGDGVINSADVVCLINYLFKDGPMLVGC